jgi:cytochrome c556
LFVILNRGINPNMKKAQLALLALAASGFVVTAQDTEKFEGWMKSVDTSAKVLRKLEKKTGPEAVESAEKLGAAYENMIAFWRQKGAADAVKLSEDGKAAAVELASAANAGDDTKSAAAFTRLGATCRPCHEAHRDKTPEGKYKIK